MTYLQRLFCLSSSLVIDYCINCEALKGITTRMAVLLWLILGSKDLKELFPSCLCNFCRIAVTFWSGEKDILCFCGCQTYLLEILAFLTLPLSWKTGGKSLVLDCLAGQMLNFWNKWLSLFCGAQNQFASMIRNFMLFKNFNSFVQEMSNLAVWRKHARIYLIKLNMFTDSWWYV